MKEIRKSVVSGGFYPNSTESLAADVEKYLSKVKNEKIDCELTNLFGLIVPHAGYFFSGQCAAYAYNFLQRKNFKRVVIIAPSHRIGGFKFSVGNYKYYETPLGKIEVDREFVEKLLAHKDFTYSSYAHSTEHSLEVQLPFLQTIKDNFKLVPIIFGKQNFENSIELSAILAEIFKNHWDETALIISSDLSHYYSAQKAVEKDNKLIENLKKLDIKQMKKDSLSHETEACGIGGILTIIDLAKKLNFPKVKILKYMNSGEVNQDKTQVVGYLSAAIYR